MDIDEQDYIEEEDEVLIVEPPEDIRAYLKGLYPSAPDEDPEEYAERIEQYVDIIRTHDTEKLPPTETSRLYAEKAQLSNKLKQEVKELKTEILREYLSTGHQIGLLSIRPNKGKREFSQDGFYEWVSNLPAVKENPELLEFMTRKVIDVNKFLRLEAEGKLAYDEIPDTIEKRSKPGYTINIDGSRKKS